MSTQKFHRGDVVHIAKDLGPWMDHFRADTDAIVLYSYADKYGGAGNFKDYGVMFYDTGNECAWYFENQLTFLRHGGEDEISKVLLARARREFDQRNLNWIVANWLNIRENVPGATMEELMRRVGINNPWGSHGEGITYYENCMRAFLLLDSVLSTGDLQQVEAFLVKVTSPQ